MAERSARVRALGAVAAVLVVAGCSAGPSPAPTAGASQIAVGPTSPPPSASSAAPTTAVTPAGTPVPSGWHAAPIQPWFATVEFTDVVWTGTRFVATVSGPGDGGTFADSTDGVTWNLQTPGAANWRPQHLAAGPSGVEAIGEIGDALASWTSSDGLTWKAKAKALPLPSLGGDSVFVSDVVGSSDGWLAVGRREPACAIDCGSNPSRAYVWRSSDGLAWSRVADQASLKGGGMAAVARLEGGFVAAGTASARPAVWASPDGTAWTRLPDGAAFREPTQASGTLSAAATGVAIVGATDLVAVVGSAYSQDSCVPDTAANLCPGARAWWSTDGEAWTKATVDLPIDGQVFSATSTPNGLLAVGPSGACLGGIWSSADGMAWTCEATDAAFTGFGPYAAAASSTIEVAVGLTSAGWDESGDLGMPGSIWVRTLP
jgi:hypothetical protein